MTSVAPESSPATVAGVDLGSNSFHMVVARADDSRLKVVDRMRERVQLAQGLDARRNLNEDTMSRALACLERFGQRVRELPAGTVRATGTNTLRQARNAGPFLERAQLALGHPIEIISGREEARLIYLGVAHNVPDDAGRRLVVDIGGGSTECIIGEGFDPLRTESLYMGCVSYSLRFFVGGSLLRDDFRRAELAARLELEPIERRYKSLGWRAAYGSSGTVLAIAELLTANGLSDGGITRAALKRLRTALCEAGHASKLKLAGLEPDRVAVLPGGLAILMAVFKSLEVDSMKPSTGALREGLLYDLLGRIRHEDVRDRTIRSLSVHYGVDAEHAMRVAQSALYCLDQVVTAWRLDREEARQYLVWAAELHEIGIEVSHAGYQKHSAYLVENADMPGFSQNEQRLLAAVVLVHRRKFLSEHFARVPSEKLELALRLGVLFRLAACLNRSRSTEPLPEFTLLARKNALELSFPKAWLEEHPLTKADLEADAERLGAVGFALSTL